MSSSDLLLRSLIEDEHNRNSLRLLNLNEVFCTNGPSEVVLQLSDECRLQMIGVYEIVTDCYDCMLTKRCWKILQLRFVGLPGETSNDVTVTKAA